MHSRFAHLQAKAKWEVAYERMSLELAPPDSGPPWDKRPRDLQTALQLARTALNEIEAAYGLGLG
jgi:hypothetical protein